MKAIVLKELAALRPAWLAALGLSLSPLFPLPEWLGPPRLMLSAFLFYLGCVLLAVDLFGHEFTRRTFPLLLAQPTSRNRLWWGKLAAFGVAIASAGLLYSIALAIAPGPSPADVAVVRKALAVGCVAAFGIGLLGSIWLRQAAAVFWLTLFTPLGLLGLTYQVCEWLERDVGSGTVAAIVQLAAGLGGAALAYRAFLRAEDVNPLGAEVTLRSLGQLWKARPTATPERASGSWKAQLRGKEIRLQQLTLVLVAGFSPFIALIYGWELRGSVDDMVVEGLKSLWLMVWALVPLLVGTLAVAEERRLGTFDGQLVLPIARTRQWWIKVRWCYAIAFALGVVLPTFLELLVQGLLGREIPGLPGMLLVRLLCWLGATTLGLFASSLARTLMTALSIVAGLVLAGFLVTGTVATSTDRFQPSPLPLFLLVSALVIFPTLFWLARRNYCAGTIERWLVRQNVVALVVVLFASAGLTAGIYGRAWETLQFVPAPGPAIAKLDGVQARLCLLGEESRDPAILHVLVALTPDGSLWTCEAPPRRLAPDSRWLEVSAGTGETPSGLWAVKTDGTLWVWTMPLMARYGIPAGSKADDGEAPKPEPAAAARDRDSLSVTSEPLRYVYVPAPSVAGILGQAPRQFGSDTDWRSVSAGARHVVGLKRDGSLWGWGENSQVQFDGVGIRYRHQPVRMGPEGSRWKSAAAGLAFTLAVAEDGTLWRWGLSSYSSRKAKEQDQSAGALLHQVDARTNWTEVNVSGWFECARQLDGSLWIIHDLLTRDEFRLIRCPGEAALMVGLGMYSQGLQLALLGADGRLRNYFGGDQLRQLSEGLMSAEFRPISSRTDWVALHGKSGTVHALTADGWLWKWSGLPGPWIRCSQKPRPVAQLK